MLRILFIRHVLILSFSVALALVYGQAATGNKNPYRVLILLDASGSMADKWGGKSKLETARELLYQYMDSTQRANPDVEFALRALGHQWPRTQRNCTDSKLEVPFRRQNATAIKKALEQIKPQGMTPIAYSLLQAVNDFPKEKDARHFVLLVTDGEENCEGNPCEAAQAFMSTRIGFKPYIIGMGTSDKFLNSMQCAGVVLPAASAQVMQQQLQTIITQTVNPTTIQINLVDPKQQANITNIPMTLYENSTQRHIHTFIHTMNRKNVPDTFSLDPNIPYDLVVHTSPVICKKNIQLTAGIHNIVSLPVSEYSVTGVTPAATFNNQSNQLLVQEKSTAKTIGIQEMNAVKKYTTASTQLIHTTLPFQQYDTLLQVRNDIAIPFPGSVTFQSTFDADITLLYKKTKQWVHVLQGASGKKSVTYNIQPGEYLLVYRNKQSTETESSKTKIIVVDEGRNTYVNLD